MPYSADQQRQDRAELLAIWEADLEQLISEMVILGNQVVLVEHLQSVKADLRFQHYELVGPNFSSEG